jgi:hypothetical protein
VNNQRMSLIVSVFRASSTHAFASGLASLRRTINRAAPSPDQLFNLGKTIGFGFPLSRKRLRRR